MLGLSLGYQRDLVLLQDFFLAKDARRATGAPRPTLTLTLTSPHPNPNPLRLGSDCTLTLL